MYSFLQDVHYSLRLIAKAPGFAPAFNQTTGRFGLQSNPGASSSSRLQAIS